MSKWEYLFARWSAKHDGAFDQWLNLRGTDGWELVHAERYTGETLGVERDCWFKRAVEAKP